MVLIWGQRALHCEQVLCCLVLGK
uniref:Uncharacterized protein n=1 Tax=Arundo donax TaxID=35708 RepID=A0A0A8Z3T1_ARUDO